MFFRYGDFFAVSGAIACGSEENPGRWFCRSGNLPYFYSSETAISETAVSELLASYGSIQRIFGCLQGIIDGRHVKKRCRCFGKSPGVVLEIHRHLFWENLASLFEETESFSGNWRYFEEKSDSLWEKTVLFYKKSATFTIFNKF